MRRIVAVAALVLMTTSCGQAAQPGSHPSTVVGSTGWVTPDPTTTPTAAGPTPTPTSSTTAAEWQLRYALLRHYPTFAFCDPDYYPIARGDEQVAADDWWASVDRFAPEVATIMAEHGYRAPITAEQRLVAYRDHKKLRVIMVRTSTDGYVYELSISVSGGEPDHTVQGVISADGLVQERSRQLRVGGCPICLEAETRIATPSGEVPVTAIRPGDIVWTTDVTGRRIAAAVAQTVRRDTPGPHLQLRLALFDGRVLIAAGAHPGSDGRFLRELRVGQSYDGATVVSAAWVVSTTPATFDILPAGPTGTYWANDILVGSTLKP